MTPELDVRRCARLIDNIEQVIQGKTETVELAVLCLIAEGHLLVEDVPGVGKTSLAKALARSVDAPFGRVQFTPDLLPADVVGTSIWNRAESVFEFRPGPIFAGIVLGDEINRAPPKTQSALLEAMAEGQVTVDGATYPMRAPFMVIATQNPIEHEGTYRLPESQMDRFLLRTAIGYPSVDAELSVLDVHGASDPLRTLEAVLKVDDVAALRESARRVHVAPPLQRYVVELAAASRRHSDLDLAMSPRAVLHLQRAAQARAVVTGRDYVTPDDLKRLAEPVLVHRLRPDPDARVRGVTAQAVVTDLLASVPVPQP